MYLFIIFDGCLRDGCTGNTQSWRQLVPQHRWYSAQETELVAWGTQTETHLNANSLLQNIDCLLKSVHCWMLFLFCTLCSSPLYLWDSVAHHYRAVKSITSVSLSKDCLSLNNWRCVSLMLCAASGHFVAQRSNLQTLVYIFFPVSSKQSEDHPEEEAVRRCGQPVWNPPVWPGRPPRGLVPSDQQWCDVSGGPELHRATGWELTAAAAISQLPAKTDHASSQRQPSDSGHLERPDRHNQGP